MHERLVEFGATARLTVDVNPLIEETTTVEMPDAPMVVETLVGFAAIPKSWT